MDLQFSNKRLAGGHEITNDFSARSLYPSAMKTIVAIAWLAALISVSDARAEPSPQDRHIIENLNEALNQFGIGSKIKIRYKDVVLSTSRVGRFFTLKSPTIIHNADGMHYELSARGISLKEVEQGIWHASIPQTLHLTREPLDKSAPPEKMIIKFYGSPLIKLKMDYGNHFAEYDIDATEKIELRTREELETGYPGAPIGTTYYNGALIETDGWQEIEPIAPADIAKFLKTISRKDGQ